MKRKSLLLSIIGIMCMTLSKTTHSQSFTINTPLPFDTLEGIYGLGTLNAGISFNIENTNDNPVILTQVEMIMNYAAFFSGTIPTLWYSVSLAGPSYILPEAGWIVISTGTPVYITGYGYYPLFQNLAFAIPPHTQYRFALQSTKGFREDTYRDTGTYENNGVVFKVGTASSEPGLQDTVGYAGEMPELLGAPAFFSGRITLEPASTTPVTLLNLTAAYNKSNHCNIINWQTAQEVNSSHFVLQKSYNPPQFTNVASIPAAGNSSIQKNYSYTDNAIQYKPTYYRLQQTDKDGRSTYSKTVQVKPVKNNDINIFPNPAHNSLTMQYTGKSGITSLVITDMLGRQVQKNILSSAQGYNQSFINITSLSPGTYTVTLQNKEEIVQQRFVKAQ